MVTGVIYLGSLCRSVPGNQFDSYVNLSLTVIAMYTCTLLQGWLFYQVRKTVLQQRHLVHTWQFVLALNWVPCTASLLMCQSAGLQICHSANMPFCQYASLLLCQSSKTAVGQYASLSSCPPIVLAKLWLLQRADTILFSDFSSCCIFGHQLQLKVLSGKMANSL